MSTNSNTVETPTLLMDVNQVERNLQFIMEKAKTYGVAYRPHIKTHKSIDIAKMQMEAGAIGLTVATVGEAEVMVEGGLKDIFIAYPISAESKLQRIKKLQDQANLTLTVDSQDQAEMLGTYFTAANPVEVWIKVNSGLNRCGVEPMAEVLALAQAIERLPGLHITGLYTHAGHAYGAGTVAEIEAIAAEEVKSITDSASLCENNGIHIPHRSVGATPTFAFYSDMSGITEIRPGNAVFFDMVQVGLGVATKEQCALTVEATVVSVKEGRIVIDAGSKTLALDKGAHGNDSIMGHGYIIEYPELIIEKLSEEHGVIPTKGISNLKVGERVTIIPNHACPVVNLFESYHVHQGGDIVDRWKVSARGRIQ